MNLVVLKKALKGLKSMKIGNGRMNWKLAWNALRLASTILVHKACVAFFCIKAGMYWRALTHDLSKFHPKEFLESIHYSETGASPIPQARKSRGWSEAWLHHKGCNSHHYEYWVDEIDDCPMMVRMPLEDALELLCDGLGASIAYNWKVAGLYEREFDWWVEGPMKKARMHPHTRAFIHAMRKRMRDERSCECLDPVLANMEYDALKYRLAGIPVACPLEECSWKEPEDVLDKEFWKA